ncbi:MAG: LD-carboxypeptidase [Lachnospiraceae bacterium]|nr:LD-carboxypeptidase [Lachnospiraceae bacterium]MDE6254524.1 LD-carboxypeptidase [Lachnospiraceae bacterium]
MDSNHKAGIVCCSNGQKISYAEKINYLESTLLNIGVKPVFSDFIYEKTSVFSGTAQERAKVLMEFYKDNEIEEIFDISGGDIANGILPYLDYELIKKSSGRLWGYSDLTTVINAIYAKTGKPSVLYQIRNLIYDFREQQISDFKNTVMENKEDLFKLNYRFVQHSSMKGVVVGGNIRCFLKLAGTEYMPDLEDKILLLESLGGSIPQIETYLCQLYQLGAFDKVAGILLGTFTQMEKEGCFPDVETLIKKFVRADLPVAITKNIGHGTNSKGIVIGQKMMF